MSAEEIGFSRFLAFEAHSREIAILAIHQVILN
jgi:hypothetical protein